MIRTKATKTYHRSALLGTFLAVLLLMLFSIRAGIAGELFPPDKMVAFTSEVTFDPPSVTLKWQAWPNPPANGSYRIQRAPIEGGSFAVVSGWPGWLPKETTQWTDVNVMPGASYHYQVERWGVPSSPGIAYGFNPAGIELPLVHTRGTALVIVEDCQASALDNELKRFESDLAGDGWTVLRTNFATALPYAPTVNYKAQIQALKNLIEAHDPTTVILVGRLPIARTGVGARDGHDGSDGNFNHQGAWAADTFYAATESWTDTIVNNSNSAFPENHNIPNDGKWDQDGASDVVREIGRIDLHNMSGFSSQTSEPHSARELLAKYFHKNHQYRVGSRSYTRQGLITSLRLDPGEDAVVRTSFAGMFGLSGVHEGSYFPALLADDYL